MHAAIVAEPKSRPATPARILLLAGCSACLIWTPTLLAAWLSGHAPAPSAAADEVAEPNFPYAIPVTLSMSDEGFRAGDIISITSVRGDRPHLEPSGTYLVQGSYTLGSATTARLALSLTSSANGGRGSWADSQHTRIERGSGTYAFVAPMHADGRFHVSFYFPDPDRPGYSSSGGGIYFDER